MARPAATSTSPQPTTKRKPKRKGRNQGGGGDSKGGNKPDRPGQEPFNPLAPAYETVGDFNKAVRQRTRPMIQPLLQDLRGERREENAMHRGREADILKYGGYQTDQLKTAFDSTRAALNELIATQNAHGTAAQGALRAALGDPNANNAVQADPSQAAVNERLPAQMGALNAIDQGVSAGTTGLFGSLLSGMGGRIGVSGVAMNEAQRGEDRRHRTARDEIREGISDVRARIPGLREQMRGTILDEERQSATQRVQNRLAQEQLGLSKRELDLQETTANRQNRLANKQLGLSKRQQRHQEALDRANLVIARTQVDQEQQRIDLAAEEARKAGNPDKAARLEAEGKRWASGVETMTSYLAPADGEVGKNGRLRDDVDYGDPNSPYYKNPRDLLSQLTGVARMPSGEALRLMKTSTIPHIRHFAVQHLRLRRGKSTYDKRGGRPGPD